MDLGSELTPEERAELRQFLAERRKGVDVDSVRIEKRETLPPPTTSGNDWLERLGQVGSWTIWLVRRGLEVIGVLMLPLTYQQGVDFYVPKLRATVEEISALLDDVRANPGRPRQEFDHMPGYIAYNPEWRNLADSELVIHTALENFNINQDNMTIVASTTASQDIIAGSGYIPGGSTPGTGHFT